MNIQLFKLFVLIGLCNGQLANFIVPGLNVAREIVDEITKHPLVTLASEATENIITTAVQTFGKIPMAVARMLHIHGSLPILINDSNVLNSFNSIISDYNAGLGNEDVRLDIRQIITKYNYPIEEHDVITEDGYELSVFRIPRDGPVVFLMHGLLGSADDYVIAGPESGLAYLLAKEGYDVWMGNARGNKHSRRHTELQPSDVSFWDFSWHEIGIYDLPAMIDYTLDTANKTSLKYIGHSQGTTSFFVMASERPDYNEKISLMVALSPVAFMSHARSPVVRLLASGTPLLHEFTRTVGLYEFLPDNAIMKTLKLLMCGTGPLAEILCSNVMFLISGFGFGQLNVTNLPVFYGHTPSGASVKQLAHYGQGVISGDFRQFDYGAAKNYKRYGSAVPPKYALEKIISPVSLFYSEEDWLAHPVDVDELYDRLGNAVDIYKVLYSQFNHLDFLFAKDFKTLIYERLRKLLFFK